MLSCQYEIDDYQENHQHLEKKGYKIKRITLNDAKQNPVAYSKLTNPVKNKTLNKLNHKIVNDTINDFSIDTEIGTFIESGNYHSYTFKVIRPNGSNFLLENLVLSKEGSDDYIIYLYQYDLTDQELHMLKQGININIQDKVTSILIDNPNLATDILAREYPCFVETATWIYGTSCSGNGHHAYGEPCDKTGDEAATPGYIQYSYVLTTCNDNGGDDFSNTDVPFDPGDQAGGPGSNTGTGNDGTNPDYDPTDPDLHDHTVVTTPTLEEFFEEEEEEIDCNITVEHLNQLFPNSTADVRNKLLEMINDVADDFDINTKDKICHFLAQTGAETGGLTSLNKTENLNYTTSSRLVEVFPNTFSLTDPTKINPTNYTNNPQALANLIYCCKYGNGNEASGDGWKYRGRGVIQLTWKGNYDGYVSFLSNLGLSWTYDNPNDLENVYQHSISSGMWFFKKNVLDKMEIDANTTSNMVTKKINRYAPKDTKVIRENYLILAKSIINCQ